MTERLAQLWDRFEASDILLVEWETNLLARLGYPLVSHGDLFFLVPDLQLPTACDIAASLGLCLADENALRPAYTSELSGVGVRYLVDDDSNNFPLRRRLGLLPLSWTGIAVDELVPISSPTNSIPWPSFPVRTVPLPVACATFVRMAARERRGSSFRMGIIGELANVIAYSLFDMTYEGDHMEFLPDDQPLSDKEKLEMENAVGQINTWVFRDDEEWIRLALVQVVTGKASYDDLPSNPK
ncbi:hypothetical protein GGS23DRAFT_154154 [Durotheca rogersii]|uniref:uncharacterized protein n=1 Tax=Durotheca rogersii TaxID=419775 RepID=UPI00221EEBC1|nr:uncharacterized protein GGS23DRAFT_154154 [Durotheca rogersii]KAI5861124.1 hypothetical protein GGS23DRAFT_154154 [Durotheca rogersii]